MQPLFAMKPLCLTVLMVWLINVHSDIVPVYGKPFKKPFFYSDTSEYRGDVLARLNGRTYIAFWKHEANKKTRQPECIDACLIELDEKMQVLKYIQLPLKYLKNPVNWRKVMVHKQTLMLLFSTIDEKNSVCTWYKLDVADMKLSKTAQTLAIFDRYTFSENLSSTAVYSRAKTKLLIEHISEQADKRCLVRGFVWDPLSGQSSAYTLKNQNRDLLQYRNCLSDQGVVWKVFTPAMRLRNRSETTLLNPLRKNIFKWDGYQRDSNGVVGYIDPDKDSMQRYRIMCGFIATSAQCAFDRDGAMHCYLNDLPDLDNKTMRIAHLKLKPEATMLADSSSFRVSLEGLLKPGAADPDQDRYHYALNRVMECETGFICIIERSFVNTYKRSLNIGGTFYNYEETSNMSDAAILLSHHPADHSFEQSYCKFETPENLRHSMEGLICFSKAPNQYVLAGETQYFPFDADAIKNNRLLLEFPVYNNLQELNQGESFLYTFTADNGYIKVYRLGYESRFVLYEQP